MVEFCLKTSAVRTCPSHDGSTFSVVTALAPPPHPRFSRFFSQIKEELGFGIYVPDCDTTACSFSAATQAGSDDPILDQPLLDFYAGYQVRARQQRAAGHGADERQHRLRRRDRHLDRQSRRRAALRQRPRPDAQSRRARSQLPQLRPLEDPRDAVSGSRRSSASSASSAASPKAARSRTRARTSITCRNSTRPISAAATPTFRSLPARDPAHHRSDRHVLVHSRGRARLRQGRADRQAR